MARPALTQQQIRAIFARNRRKGMRAVINKLRERGHRASDWQTFYHGTTEERVPSIIKEGLRGGSGNISTSRRGTVYLGNRDVARYFANWSSQYTPDRALVKVRVPKEHMQLESPMGLYVKNKWMKEHRHIGPIESAKIRNIRIYRETAYPPIVYRRYDDSP